MHKTLNPKNKRNKSSFTDCIIIISFRGIYMHFIMYIYVHMYTCTHHLDVGGLDFTNSKSPKLSLE
jgi:hypothetical protein